jgi:broad specificity phosphatase PhoE
VGEIVLIRHGQTEWSAVGKHTSFTDLELTAEGEQQARVAGKRLAGRRFVAVISSPRRRARQTAELAGLRVTEVSDDLAEWNYGKYEGITTPEIWEIEPGWSLWTDGAPGGEAPEQVAARLDRVLARARTFLDDGDVALVAHGHSLRVAGARWIGLAAEYGGRLKLGTATLSILGFDHEQPAIEAWNT